MSKSHPDSSAKLEGGQLGTALPAPGDQASTAQQMAQSFLPNASPMERTTDRDDGDWLLTAQQCYRTSTDFFDANLRTRIEESMDLYRSQHPKGSKYNLPSYAKRSRLFRPKTRSAMQRREANIAKAFFSTTDIVDVQPPNKRDKGQVKAAEIQKQLLNYRLKKTMRWFQIVIGAFQDACRQGFVVSRTDWDFKTSTRYYTATDENGDTIRTSERVVRVDTPKVTLIPAENIRLSPGCDWTDPIGTSDFLIELMPMSIREVMEMRDQEQTPYKWREFDEQTLMSGTKQTFDSVRSSREGSRTDRYDSKTGINQYETVWVHRNIIRIEGEDYIYLTAGTEQMLTDPQPLSDIDPRGYRGYEWGFTVVESHNPYPDGPVQMGKPTQEEINDLANTRADATKMAMMGRYFVKRNSNVDVQALVRPVPGSAVEMSNVQSDVRWDRPQEAGRTAYEEHNLLTTEIDDLWGNFSQSSVAADRKLGETVGGMKLIADNSNEVTEFSARTFSETWVLQVLTHVVDLECLWETDQALAQLIGEQLKTDQIEVFRALKSPMGVEVNVGFGSTNPESRVRRLQMGLGILGAVAPDLMMQANQAEIANEVFGALGYQSAARFFPSLEGEEDPQVAQLRKQVEQLTGMLEGKQMEMQSKEKIAQITAESRVRIEEIKGANATRLFQLKAELDVMLLSAANEIKLIDLRIKFETNEQKKMELYMQREALSHTIQMAEREFALKVQSMAAAAGQEAQAKPQPAGVAGLVESLKDPPSGSVNLDDGLTQGDMGGDTQAGVISRGDYGNIPGKEG